MVCARPKCGRASGVDDASQLVCVHPYRRHQRRSAGAGFGSYNPKIPKANPEGCLWIHFFDDTRKLQWRNGTRFPCELADIAAKIDLLGGYHSGHERSLSHFRHRLADRRQSGAALDSVFSSRTSEEPRMLRGRPLLEGLNGSERLK